MVEEEKEQRVCAEPSGSGIDPHSHTGERPLKPPITRGSSSFASSNKDLSQITRPHKAVGRRAPHIRSTREKAGGASSLPAIPSGTASVVGSGKSGERGDEVLSVDKEESPELPLLPSTSPPSLTSPSSVKSPPAQKSPPLLKSPPSLTSPPTVKSPSSLTAPPSPKSLEANGARAAASEAGSAADPLSSEREGLKVNKELPTCVNQEKPQVKALTTPPHPAYRRQTVFSPSLVGQWEHEQEVDRHLLGHIRRYDRLNHILSLLQQVQEGEREGEGEGERVRVTELREHIRSALDEAVRLRADTNSLHHRTKVHTH